MVFVSPKGQTGTRAHQLLAAFSLFVAMITTAVAQNAIPRTLQGHTDQVNSVAFSPDGRTLLSGSRDNSLRLWDTSSGQLLRTFNGHSGWVDAVAFSPNGRTVLSASEDATLKLWDVTSGRLLHTFRGHSFEVTSVAFSPDGKTALSGSVDETTRQWDIATGRLLRTFKNTSAYALAFSPDGKTALLANEDMKLLDLASGRVLRTFKGHTKWVHSVAFSTDGQTAFSGSADNTLKHWDIASGRLLQTIVLTGHSSEVSFVTLSPNRSRAVSASTTFVGGVSSTIQLWDLASGRLLATLNKSDHVGRMAFAPDGHTALWPKGRTLELLDLGGADHTMAAAPAPGVAFMDGPSPIVETDLSTRPRPSSTATSARPVAPAAAVAAPPTSRPPNNGLPSKPLAPPAASMPASSPSGQATALDIPATPQAPSQAAQAAAAMFDKPLTPPPGTPVPPPAPIAPVPALVAPERRVALVVSNSSYAGMPRLPNPSRDAKAVASALRQVGFSEVIEVSDLSRAAMISSLNVFSDKAANADWAMVYYAGHGMEMNGINYLIPVDAKLVSDRDVADEAISLDRVLTGLSSARKLRLVVLDACRNNPFDARMARTVANRAVTRGLAPVEPGGSTLVVYAAKHGQVALDGEGANSPFVTALTRHMTTPRLEVDKMFRRVAADVLRATGNRQEPFTYGRLPEDDLYFAAK